jgi:HEAT repeat protein
MKLAYYSTRRDRKSGWMQLELGAGRARLSLDSRLDGFDRLVRYAAIAAAERGLQPSEATAANLQAMGIRIPDQRGTR